MDPDIQAIATWYFRVLDRKSVSPAERDAWIAAARRQFQPSLRQPCIVCGQFKSIAQAHHVVPLATQWERGFEYPDHEHEWLCPNHHVIVHLFIFATGRSMRVEALRARARTTRSIFPDISAADLDKVIGLIRRAMRGPQ